MSSKAASSPKAPEICLMMIVRNEEKTLPRLISSVLPVISSWVIIDTGSTDNTQEVAQSLLSHLPGKLLEKEWVNFGHNRSELVSEIPNDADFALLLDADHVLHLESEEDFFREVRKNNQDDCLMIEVVEEKFTCSMPYLIRSGPKYRFVGSTHEHLTADTALKKSQPLKSLQLNHIGDGGSKGDKFERDRYLLEQDLLNGGDNSRTRFYLGQTLESLGLQQEAVEQYTHCKNLSTWDEEKYIASLRIGRILQKSEDSNSALVEFFTAYEICPDRSEALYEIVKILQQMNGYKFAHRALNNAHYASKTRILFIETWTRDFSLPIEEAVIAWNVGHVQEAKEKFTAVLNKPGITPDLEALVLKNLEFC